MLVVMDVIRLCVQGALNRILLVSCFYCGLVVGQEIQLGQLFPSTWYTQALEVCMRVMADKKHTYDPMTASDLCLGRLVRLYDIVGQMEVIHATKRPYCPEDITYMLALVRTVHKVRSETLAQSKQAVPLIVAIEKRLVKIIGAH